MKNPRETLWKYQTLEELLKTELFSSLHDVYQLMAHKPLLFPMDETQAMNEVGYQVTWLCETTLRIGEPDMEQFQREVYAYTGLQEHAMTVFSLVYATTKLVNFPPLPLGKECLEALHRLNKRSWCGLLVETFVRNLCKSGFYFKYQFKSYKPIEYKVVEEDFHPQPVAWFAAEDSDDDEPRKRTFTLDEIVDYAAKHLTLESSFPIQNMLNYLLIKDGTQEERELVASISDKILNRDKPAATHTENVAVKYVETEIQKVEKDGIGVNKEIKKD